MKKTHDLCSNQFISNASEAHHNAATRSATPTESSSPHISSQAMSQDHRCVSEPSKRGCCPKQQRQRHQHIYWKQAAIEEGRSAQGEP
jgi:hypothetical protein